VGKKGSTEAKKKRRKTCGIIIPDLKAKSR